MKRISTKKKLFITICFTLLIVISSIRTCYAANVTYTRTQLQNSVVSTAVTYLYNNEYSDYSQKLIDGGSGYYNVDVFWNNGKPTYSESGTQLNNYNVTYPFRTFNQSPDSASRTNRFYIDCSSFAMSTSIYGLGVDFSEYGQKSTYPKLTATSYYSNGGQHYPLGNSSCTTTSCDNSRINLFKNSYKYYNGRVLATSIMDNVINSIKDGNPTMNITYSVNKNSASIKNKFVVYFITTLRPFLI